MVESYGYRAASEAAMRAELALVKGDATEIAVWQRIERAIEPLHGKT
jgi:hypothetical protein